MKGAGAMMISGVVLQISEATTYSGWIMAVIAMGFYIKLRMSDPFRQLERSMEMVRQLTHTAEELKVENLALRNRNEQLNTELQAIHAECSELRSNLKLLKVAFEKNGETIARLAEDLKAERQLRDDQFMQWTRERAKHGDL